MLSRGFKTRAENISLQLRRSLNLRKIDPITFESLSAHLDVLLWKPTDIVGLSPEIRKLLLGNAKDSWSAVTISYGGINAIIYNSLHSKARQSSDVMHELSHIIFNHAPSTIVISPGIGVALREYNTNQEEEADWLSGCILLPREALLFIKKSGASDDETLRKYRVSKDLLYYRINVTGVNYQLTRRYG